MKKKNQPYYGLTPAQIRRAIYGPSSTPDNRQTAEPIQEKQKPEKAHRPAPNALVPLKEVQFTTTQTAAAFPTPNWPTSNKVDVSLIMPLFRNNAAAIIDNYEIIRDGMRVELIFVDDNCPVDSKTKVREGFEKAGVVPVGRILQSSVTQGWGACCNIGAEAASGTYLVFLDPRGKPEPNWLRPLIRQARNNHSAASGLLFNHRNEIVSAGMVWSWEEGRFMAIGGEIYKGHKLGRGFKTDNAPFELSESGERECLDSSLLCIEKIVFHKVGGFHPILRTKEWADADLCLRLREKGHKVIFQPSSKAQIESQSKDPKDRNRDRTFFHNHWVTTGRMDELVASTRSERPVIRAILVHRSAAHGDVLLAAAVAPALKKKYPNAKILFETECPEVLRNNPWIDEINSDRKDYQLYVNLDMAYEYRPQENILDVYADVANVSKADCQPFIDMEPHPIPQPYIVVHAGRTLWVGRNWSTYKFDMLSYKLKGLGHSVVCVGTSSDTKPAYCDVDLRGKTTIYQLAEVIKNSQLFVGIDSFPMHIAQTLNVPGVCFFGSIKPETRLIGNSIQPVTADVSCLGCHQRQPKPCPSTTTCEVGVEDCINMVSVEMVLAKISDKLKDKYLC